MGEWDMDQELCRQLKDAGFPIHEYEGGDFNMFGYCINCLQKEEHCKPTLSELIEACGDNFYLLVAGHDFEGKIYAWGVQKYEGDPVKCEYKTPEEAVARLFLALKKK